MKARVSWVALGFILFAMTTAYGILSLQRIWGGYPTGVYTTLRNVEVWDADPLANAYLIGPTSDNSHVYHLCPGFNPNFHKGMKLKLFKVEQRRYCQDMTGPNTGWE